MRNFKLIYCSLLLIAGMPVLMGFYNPKDPELDKAVAVIEKLNMAYAGRKAYSVQVQHSFFPSYASRTVVESYAGFFTRSGGKEHSLLMGIETIQDDNDRVIIDTAIKRIIVAKRQERHFLPENLASVRQLLKSAKVMEKEDGNILLVLNMKSEVPDLNSMEMTISKDNHLLKMVLFHKEKQLFSPGQAQAQTPRTEVAFSGFSTRGISTSDFDYGKYISTQKGVYKLKQAYKNFDLIILK